MKMIWLVLVLLITTSVAYASDVGYVVSFPDGSVKKGCAQVNSGIDGYQLLEATDLGLTWTPQTIYGHALCKIDSVGDDVSGTMCSWSGSWWNFDVLVNGSWAQMPVGYDATGGCWNRDILSFGGHYCVTDGDVLGWVYGDGTTYPSVYSFDDLCRKLQITGLKSYVDSDKSSVSVDGGRIKDVKPGSELELVFEVSNLFDKDEDIVIENVFVNVIIEGIDDGDDMEEESDEVDIDADDNDDLKVTFDIPLSAEEDIYTVIVNLEGNSENGLDFEEEYELELELDKASHDLRILDAVVSPTNVRCDRKVRLDTHILNIGTSKEDVKLRIENSDLGIDFLDTFKLSDDPDDDDSSDIREYSLTLPGDASAGTYNIKVTAEYGSNKETDTISLKVDDCDNVVDSSDIGEVVLIIQKTAPVAVPDSIAQQNAAFSQANVVSPAPRKENNFFSSPIGTMVLFDAFIILIVVIIAVARK